MSRSLSAHQSIISDNYEYVISLSMSISRMFKVMMNLDSSSYLTAAISISPTIMPTVSFQLEVSEEVPVVTLNCLPVKVIALAISVIGEASV